MVYQGDIWQLNIIGLFLPVSQRRIRWWYRTTIDNKYLGCKVIFVSFLVYITSLSVSEVRLEETEHLLIQFTQKVVVELSKYKTAFDP